MANALTVISMLFAFFLLSSAAFVAVIVFVCYFLFLSLIAIFKSSKGYTFLKFLSDVKTATNKLTSFINRVVFNNGNY